ncbi:MAG TPA: NAD(P)H-binding protein [Pseudonocardiaceae bacterium]
MILVTGATGNVGRALVHALVAGGAAVRALARNPNGTTFPPAVDVTAADLEAPDTLTPALASIRKVFLLGGFTAMPTLLERLRDADVEHVVLLTSRCVVGGNPDNAITCRWLDSEAAVQGSGIPWTILRPSGFTPTPCAGFPSYAKETSSEPPGRTCASLRSTLPISPPSPRPSSPNLATSTPRQR